jgi:hypothetical protein
MEGVQSSMESISHDDMVLPDQLNPSENIYTTLSPIEEQFYFEEEADSVGEESKQESMSENVVEEPHGDYSNGKRISLQRFTIYNSSPTMYIVGSNAKETLFRILEIGRDPNNPNELVIIEDKSFFYTRKDMVDLLNSLDESIDGGIHKIAQGYGLIGLIKFTRDYYLSIITKCSQVAIIGGHYIYHIDETKLIPLNINYKRPETYSDEERLLSIFKYMDLGKTFYFSYGYDITNTLQTNMIRNKNLASTYQNNTDYSQNEIYNNMSHNERFVWNNVLLAPILSNPDCATYEWFRPIIHGFIDQANISKYGKKFYITIIARRSHHFAGARFLKRGVNDTGNVANEIETEQIVSDMLISSFHDPKFGFFNNPRFTSFVQHRGSIPLYWTQDLNKLPKPPIQINLSDPFYQSSAIHFNNLFERYGLPIIILNLIKTKEKQPRELKLNLHFIDCITYLNQFLPEENKLRYHGFDMSRHSKKDLDVIGPLQNIASESIKEIGFFHNGTDLQSTKLQVGIIRTNCIDCLDRTNAAQFIICKESLWHQLRSLELISEDKLLEYDSDVVNILTEIFHDHGDTIAIQYGGSNLVNTMDSYRRINQWSSHTRDILNSVKRIYSNSFMDLIRQEAINLFLGNYVYDPNKPKLWELQNDFHLHNDMLVVNLRMKISYMHWFNEHYLTRFLRVFEDKTQKPTFLWHPSWRLEPYPDFNDNWFNECYAPRKFQSLKDVYQFTMNSTSHYFSSSASDANKYTEYSPFTSRKPKQDVDSLISNDVAFKSESNNGDEFSRSINGETNRKTAKSNRIRKFLIDKIQKFGYTHEYDGNDSMDFDTYSSDYSISNEDKLSFNNYEALSKLKVKEFDSDIYKKDLPNNYLSCLQSDIAVPLCVNPTPADTEIYECYTSASVPRLLQLAKSSTNDFKVYSQYLGIEVEHQLAINAEDDYFR